MGPSYAHSLTIRDLEKGEPFIDAWLEDQVENLPFPDQFAKLNAFITILQNPDVYTGRQKEELRHFYLGGIFLQSSKVSASEEERIQALAESLNHFRRCLEPKTFPANPSYYAQWQIGLILEKLGSSWPEVQEALLDAQVFYNKRAEAVTYVIKRLRSNGQIGWAYVYTQVAQAQYTGKIPPDTTWGVDPGIYLWKLTNYHMSVCNRLGNSAEAAKAYRELWQFHKENPNYFSPDQVQQLFKNQQLFAHE